MGPDPLQRILLALILAGLAVLIFQDTRRPAARYEMNVVQGRPPQLVRIDTATGRVERLTLGNKGSGVWAPVGADPAPDAGDGARLQAPVEEDRPEVAALGSALAPESPSQVRIWAAELLGGLLGPAPGQAAPLLISALDDPEPAVLVAATRSLAGVRDPEAEPALRGLLEHPDPDVRLGAREALASYE